MSSRGIPAICLVALLVLVLLVPLPTDRHLLWTLALWSILLGSVVAFVGIAANVACVLAFMYFGYLPGKRGPGPVVLPFASSDVKVRLIRDAESPEDLAPELDRIEDALSNLKSTLAFHRLSEEQRHQFDRAFAELEVLIQQVSIPTDATRAAS